MDASDGLVAENLRLKRELTEAKQRVRALEESRWYRLNPRRWRRRGDSGARVPPATRPPQPTVSGADNVERFRTEVVAHGTFTEDWFLREQSTRSWEAMLDAFEGRAARILEIGSFEGMSACFLLWRLPDATVACVDTFGGGIEQRGADSLSGLEDRFDSNTAIVDASRVRKLVGDSRRVLVDLVAADERFDLVYIDGSHLGLDVLVDASLSWQLLETGGVLVFDDYNWALLGNDALLRPGPAVDAFLGLLAGKYQVVFADRQVAIRKLAA